MATRIIAFECVAAAHQPSIAHADKLTVHGGAWAFCAFDARADGHEWHETGGVDVESITRKFGLSSLALVPQQETARRA